MVTTFGLVYSSTTILYWLIAVVLIVVYGCNDNNHHTNTFNLSLPENTVRKLPALEERSTTDFSWSRYGGGGGGSSGEDVSIKNIPIIGSHQSLGYTITSDLSRLFVRTQRVSVLRQLNLGVRFVDVLLQDNEDVVPIVYVDSFTRTNTSWLSFWTTLRDWLKQNPTEGILLFLRQNEKNSNRLPGWLATIDHSLLIDNEDHLSKLSIKNCSGKLVPMIYSDEDEKLLAFCTRTKLFSVPVEGIIYRYGYSDTDTVNNCSLDLARRQLKAIDKFLTRTGDSDALRLIFLSLIPSSSCGDEVSGNETSSMTSIREIATLVNVTILHWLNSETDTRKTKGVYVMDWV